MHIEVSVMTGGKIRQRKIRQPFSSCHKAHFYVHSNNLTTIIRMNSWFWMIYLFTQVFPETKALSDNEELLNVEWPKRNEADLQRWLEQWNDRQPNH